MSELKELYSVTDLVQASLDETQACIRTISGREDEPTMVGYAEYGIPWHSSACQSPAGLQDIKTYRAFVEDTHCSAWMDNTTIVTACTLLSENGPEYMTPLTVWDLVTFVRAIVCYERIYHHKHPDFDDAKVNKLLGKEVFVSVPLPVRATTGSHPLPDPWDGAHYYMCDMWSTAFNWLKRLHESAGTDSLDGKQLQVVTEAWRSALGNPEIEPTELVNYKEVDRSWTSPSNRLLDEIADITSLKGSRLFLEPNEVGKLLARKKTKLIQERRSNILSDLNLRAHINQQIAEFFALPYACSVARLPFRRHLYDRSLRIQQELTVAGVIDNRYAELAQASQLRLPIFLAIILREARTPESLWSALSEMRKQASTFRKHREEMDQALARGDIKHASQISKALQTSAESILEVAGKATTSAGAVVLEELSKGDIPTVKTGITAAVAAAKGVFQSSFTERLMWRLHKPQLFWINDIVDQAHHLTEALPDFSRVWEIPPNRQIVFVERFQRMTHLAG